MTAPNRTIWEPLEHIASIAAEIGQPIQLEDFMFIAVRDQAAGGGNVVRIHCYKHELSRRYLNVDPASGAWTYKASTDSYEPQDELGQAISQALGPFG